MLTKIEAFKNPREAEREFGGISHDTRVPSKNRQLARSIEMIRQFCAAPSFKKLAEEAIRFEKK